MFDLKTLSRAIQQIADEKNIAPEKIIEAIEASIAAAYKREYEKRGEVIKASFDLKTGEVKFYLVKQVVDETMVVTDPEVEIPTTPVVEGELVPVRYNPDRHLLIEDAQKIKADVKVGEELEFPLETKEEFGRIAAQSAKQVILQKIREAERESIYKEWKDKEGDVVSGLVQRYERGNIFVDLGRAIGVMFYNESIPGEHYKSGDRLRYYVLAVQDDPRGPGIILSRSHPKFVSKLFSMESPEIAESSVEIKAIAREAGSRTKIAVQSNVEGLDPVGCCVGQRGTRVMAVSNELGQEKIDIIEWSEDPARFVGNALSPAKVKLVEIGQYREAKAFVAADQLSLAIGKGGQNVRLAAKLTGWKIDVRSADQPEAVQEGGIAAAAEETLPPSPEATEGKGEFIEEIKKEE